MVIEHVSGSDHMVTDETLTGLTSGAIFNSVGTESVSVSPLQLRVDIAQDVDVDSRSLVVS